MKEIAGDPERRCATMVSELIARHKWSLLDRETLLARALAALRQQPEVEIGYLVLGVYNQALYSACSGAEGDKRRQEAFEELRRMLLEQAKRREPEIGEDATQEAITLICGRLDACREPRAFFTFARQQLQLALRRLGRREHRQRLSLDRAVGEDEAILGDTVASNDEEIEEVLLSRELASEVRALLAKILRENPHAQNQIEAVRMKFLDDLDDETISRKLGISVKSVHEARSRGLRRLRSDPGFDSLRSEA